MKKQTAMPSEGRKMPTLVKLAVDVGPLVVFFGFNARDGIFTATAAFMVAILIALLTAWVYERRIPTMPLVTALVVSIFGGLTLWLQDETFIKLKPTIINVLFGIAIFVGLALGRNFIRTVMGPMMQLNDFGWHKLAVRWGFFFFAMAALNEFVWRNFSTDDWVSFKVFGLLPLTFAFALSQMPLMKSYALTEAKAEDENDGNPTGGKAD
jgi:intracellular septation protein